MTYIRLKIFTRGISPSPPLSVNESNYIGLLQQREYRFHPVKLKRSFNMEHSVGPGREVNVNPCQSLSIPVNPCQSQNGESPQLTLKQISPILFLFLDFSMPTALYILSQLLLLLLLLLL